jgi:hypothetical protein
VKKNYDAIKYINNPCPIVQEAAVKTNYEALRYIHTPTHEAECIAVKSNEQAVRLVRPIDKSKLLEFLKINILVIKYIPREMTVSPHELEQVLQEVLRHEDVDEKYVRDFINCSAIDKNNETMPIDKLMLVYQYGSDAAKRITVDEKLRIK